MDAAKNWPCWEITRCKSEDCCLSREQQNTSLPCWEIARGLDDYRSVLNVCKDCIVYVSKQENSSLSEAELTQILHSKIDCVLVKGCPHYKD